MMKSMAPCALIVASLLLAPAQAQQRNADEQKLIEALHLDPDVKLSYLDSDGKPIPPEAFISRMSQGQSFGIHKNLAAKTAALQLDGAGQKPKAFPLRLAIQTGATLPAFALESIHGRHLTNADLIGHYTLLSFYFADCLPCIAEVPTLNAFARQHQDLGVLAVTYEPRDAATRFAAQHRLQPDSLFDAQAWIDALGVETYPTLLLIGPDGHLVAATISTTLAHQGTPTAADIARWVERYRKGAQASALQPGPGATPQ